MEDWDGGSTHGVFSMPQCSPEISSGLNCEARQRQGTVLRIGPVILASCEQDKAHQTLRCAHRFSPGRPRLHTLKVPLFFTQDVSQSRLSIRDWVRRWFWWSRQYLFTKNETGDDEPIFSQSACYSNRLATLG